MASCHEIEAAASLMGFYGDGATIRIDHSKKFTIWTEGSEEQSAVESYDYVAEIASQNMRQLGYSGRNSTGR